MHHATLYEASSLLQFSTVRIYPPRIGLFCCLSLKAICSSGIELSSFRLRSKRHFYYQTINPRMFENDKCLSRLCPRFPHHKFTIRIKTSSINLNLFLSFDHFHEVFSSLKMEDHRGKRYVVRVCKNPKHDLIYKSCCTKLFIEVM